MHKNSIMSRVSDGERPQRPSSTVIPDRIWEMLQECWSEDPTRRPTIEDIIDVCMAHTTQNGPPTRPPLTSFSSRSRDNPPSQPTEARTSLQAQISPNCPLMLPNDPLMLPNDPLILLNYPLILPNYPLGLPNYHLDIPYPDYEQFQHPYPTMPQPCQPVES